MYLKYKLYAFADLACRMHIFGLKTITNRLNTNKWMYLNINIKFMYSVFDNLDPNSYY